MNTPHTSLRELLVLLLCLAIVGLAVGRAQHADLGPEPPGTAAAIAAASPSDTPSVASDSPDLASPAPEIRTLRVIAPKHARQLGQIAPFGPGMEKDLLAAFAREAGYRIAWLPPRSAQDAWRALRRGEADLFVGLGYEPPSSLSSPIAAGPAYAHYRPVLVRGARSGARSNAALCSAELASVAGEDCDAMNAELHDDGLPPLLGSLTSGETGQALVDSGRFRQWQPFFKAVKPAKSLPREIPYRWYWRAADDAVGAAMDAFWQRRETSNELQALTERYFGFFPKTTDYVELQHISEVLTTLLPPHAKAIEQAAEENGLDPLLLVALIYRESRFDAEANSRTGVRGLLQITADTARSLGMDDRLDPNQSIRGGAAYLRKLWDELEPLDLEPWDRWFFALAAYNQGPGHLYDAIALARRTGGEGRTWAELKKVYPLLSWQKYYSQAKHGHCRGNEAVAHVDSVRYYYYILHGFVALARPEAKHLGPLLGAVPVGWPLS